MIGQTNLVTKLKAYTLETLPHSILITGEYGCGKHTLVNEMKDYFGLDLFYITDNLNMDAIEQINSRIFPAFYVIDATDITEREQNVILKFLEEPSQLAYLIIICENKSTLLETVVNRCVSFEFEPYTRQELMSFVSDDISNKELLLTLCNTPGRIKLINSAVLQDMNELCLKIINKIQIANYANTLSISNKINYDKSYDKFDVKVFINCLMYNILNAYKSKADVSLYRYYNIINKYSNRLKDTRLNKEMLIENTLTELWQESRR